MSRSNFLHDALVFPNGEACSVIWLLYASILQCVPRVYLLAERKRSMAIGSPVEVLRDNGVCPPAPKTHRVTGVCQVCCLLDEAWVFPQRNASLSRGSTQRGQSPEILAPCCVKCVALMKHGCSCKGTPPCREVACPDRIFEHDDRVTDWSVSRQRGPTLGNLGTLLLCVSSVLP